MGVSGRMGENQGGLRTGWLAAFGTEGYEGEPPLMEELGVNFGHIKGKVCVCVFFWIGYDSIPREALFRENLPLTGCTLTSSPPKPPLNPWPHQKKKKQTLIIKSINQKNI